MIGQIDGLVWLKLMKFHFEVDEIKGLNIDHGQGNLNFI